jgi:hypothetical protein
MTFLSPVTVAQTWLSSAMVSWYREPVMPEEEEEEEEEEALQR